MRIRNLLPLIGAVPLVLLLMGCPFSPKDEPPPKPVNPYVPQTSPENVLKNLETAYTKKEIARFDSLLYDSEAAGDLTEGYTFVFWSEDVRLGNVPDAQWGREEEVRSANSMFSSSEVEDIDIKLTWAPPYRDNTLGHEGQWIIYVTNASLSVVTRPPNMTEPLILKVDANLARFRFKCQWVNTEGDSLWRIVRWEDLGVGAGKREIASLSGLAQDRVESLANTARGRIEMTRPKQGAALLREALLTRKVEVQR